MEKTIKDNLLKRVLGLPTATFLVVNMIIGSGIFFKTQGVLEITDATPGFALLAWVSAGIINLCGGLTVAELSGAIPETGGMVTWLKRIFGEKIGYLAGWTYAFVFWPAYMSAQANVISLQLSRLFNINSSYQNIIAISFIVFLFVMNFMGAKAGGIITNIFTVAKLMPIIFIVTAAFFFDRGSTGNLTPVLPAGGNAAGNITMFGAAILSCMFAYDGWQHAGTIAGEMKNPKKDLPKAITIGIVGVCIVYFIINLAYLYVLPAKMLVNTSAPAADVASVLFGKGIGAKLITVGIIISVFGTLNGSVLISTRIPYIMAVNNELPYSEKFTKLHPKFKTSFASFILMFVIGVTMTFLGTFNTLADMAMFSWWIFNVLAFIGVIKFRKDCPDIERPYKVPFYPFVPAVAITGGIIVLVSALITQTALALTGLALTGSGMIVYYFVKRNEANEQINLEKNLRKSRR